MIHLIFLSFGHAIFLLAAGALGGALNAVAGGGSFIAFPALLFTGVPPIPANATNNIAMWSGGVASSRAYWSRLDVPWRAMLPLLGASILGGLFGGLLLLKTPAHTFMRLIPWLLLGALLLFVFGKKISKRRTSAVSREASAAGIAAIALAGLAVAIYGGYFGGGQGILILAMVAAVGMTDIHSMNALKVVLSSTTNGVALIVFIGARVVYWPQAAVMIVGALLGGYLAAHYAQRLPQAWVRGFVILVGTGMTVYFFVKAYG